jgi:hypothetical protein
MTPDRHKLVHPHKINLNAVLGKLEDILPSILKEMY